MFEGVSYLASLMFGLNDIGMWNDKRGANLLDGGAPNLFLISWNLK